MARKELSNGYLQRWRGEVSAKLQEIGRRLDEQRQAIDRLGEQFGKALHDHSASDLQVAEQLIAAHRAV
jgi:hypothetical protein